MIQAKDLRIGNWVSITGHAIKLTGPKFLFILQEDGDLTTRCEGIPLTPEILEKWCGFEKDEEWLWYNLDFFQSPKAGRWVTNTLSGKNIDTPFLRIDGFCDLFYLHQLQNLYRDITSKELEINIPTTNPAP